MEAGPATGEALDKILVFLYRGLRGTQIYFHL